MRIATEKTDHVTLRVDSDAIAISILLERRDDWPHWNVSGFADALQSIAHLAPFNRHLMFVIDVLIGAAAATAEIRTLRFYAMRGAFFNIDKFRLRELLLLADDFDGDRLAFNRVRNKDGFALLPSDTLPAKSDVFDFKID